MPSELVLCWLLRTLSSFVISALSNNAPGQTHAAVIIIIISKIGQRVSSSASEAASPKNLSWNAASSRELYAKDQDDDEMTVCLREASAAAVAFLPSLLPLMDDHYTDMEGKIATE